VSRSEKAGGKRRGGFLLGAIVGAIVGILLAPRSGKETREQLLGGTDGVSGQVDRVRGAIEAGMGQAAEQSEALRRKIEETRGRLRHEMDGGDDASAAAGPGGDGPEVI
jgi:gas vesicle protein